jgi:hypothetical protein
VAFGVGLKVDSLCFEHHMNFLSSTNMSKIVN